jgi:Na(+)-translocating NADH:ubiquinone oxidoreductase F subunit
MKELLKRKDGPAVLDTIIWFTVIFGSGYGIYALWGTWWSMIPIMIYSLFYASSSDSRWHECGHGTAFKTDWMNDFVYEIASFMMLRESTPWKWSHIRHHSDTTVVGRDPEIVVKRPPSFKAIILGSLSLTVFPAYFKNMFLHAFGKMRDEERTYIPVSETAKVYWKARIYLLIYLFVIGLAVYFQSIFPLIYIGIPSILGAWYVNMYGLTQHSGMAENVLDHRLNCRTFYFGRINRFICWNMNYHTEHHMFPLVPYHALPKLHEIIKDDMPEPYKNIFACWREIIPALKKQQKDPTYYVQRKLPTPSVRPEAYSTAAINDVHAIHEKEGWLEVCQVSQLNKEDVLRFDFEGKTFAVYQTKDGAFYATDGICTHGNTHLAGGFVKGNEIECPRHNGRFDVRDGSVKRKPVCVNLNTYPIKKENNSLWIHKESIKKSQGKANLKFKVLSNENVATYIKELVLEPSEKFDYKPGEYIQVKIPAYGIMKFENFVIDNPFSKDWEEDRVFEYEGVNVSQSFRNYSMATNPENDENVHFNVRIATPPIGQKVSAGAGSSYIFSLKEGDTVEARGSFGDFHIKDSDKEMVYIGGGSGMAPLRSHISYLFETLQTKRKVSFWYGARSRQEIFYQEYFEKLASEHDNFSFHIALSEPKKEDDWEGDTGFIHSVLNEKFLHQHPSPDNLEYYLCGPPALIRAVSNLLGEYLIPESAISYDEF